MGFSSIPPRIEYFQGNVGCGKLEMEEFRKRPIPNLTLPRYSGSLTSKVSDKRNVNVIIERGFLG